MLSLNYVSFGANKPKSLQRVIRFAVAVASYYYICFYSVFMYVLFRLNRLTTDFNVIVQALGKSKAKLMEVSADKTKIRRSPSRPLPEVTDEYKNDVKNRSVYIVSGSSVHFMLLLFRRNIHGVNKDKGSGHVWLITVFFASVLLNFIIVNLHMLDPVLLVAEFYSNFQWLISFINF